MNSELIKSLQSRYAVKKFDPTKKLTDDQVNELMEVARLTATSYGLQLMKLLVVTNQEIKEKLVESSYGQRQVADASHVLVLCRESNVESKHIEQYIDTISETRDQEKESLSNFRNGMSNFLLTRDKKDNVIWMEKQVYIMLGQLLSACAILGIGSCPMEGFKSEEYDEILGLEKLGLASVLVLPVGFGSTDDPNATRKKVRRSEQQFVIRV